MSTSEYYPLWWLNGNNFGDMLGPWLYKRITGRNPVLSNESPRILSCGSILGRATGSDIVWGSGFLQASGTPRSKRIRVRSVRGPLSATILRKHGVDVPGVYGDPALLVHRYVRRRKRKYDVGFFPHYTNANANISLPVNSVRMRPMAPVERTLDQLSLCERVVSSSLHGIVVAESFGVPTVWVKISNSVPEFKFKDYYRGTGRVPPTPIDWRDEVSWKVVFKTKAFDNWEPPKYSEDDLLSCCPFDTRRNDDDG